MSQPDIIDLGDAVLVLAGLAGPRFSTFIRFESDAFGFGYVDNERDPAEHRIWLALMDTTGAAVNGRIKRILEGIRDEIAERHADEGGDNGV